MPRKGCFAKKCKRGHSRLGREGKSCKVCKAAAERKFWKKNHKKLTAKRKAYRAAHPAADKGYNRKVREEVLQHYGGVCFCCKEWRYEFLGIDHEFGGGTKHRKEIGGGGARLARWLKNHNYPKGYRVACHNCNLALGLYGHCPHKDSE